MRRTEIAENRTRFVAQTGPEFRDETRLTDAWFTRQQHNLPLTSLRLLPAALEQGKLLLAIDQLHKLRRVQCGESVASRTFRQDTPRPHRRAEPLERERAEVLAAEQIADQSSRDSVDRDAIGPRDFLKPRREIWRDADWCLLGRGARPYRLTDNDGARGDADAHLQPLVSNRGFGERADQGKRGTHRTLGIRFLAFGPTEITQYSVADIARDLASIGFDGCRCTGLVSADDF